MRLWSVAPELLDRQGLTGLWRETLLAQKVLAGGTRGYTRHPQLVRLRATPDPLDTVGAYLGAVRAAAARRGYRFDGARILRPDADVERMPVTEGQLAYELERLADKLIRTPDYRERLLSAVAERAPAELVHPLFEVVPGPVEDWERVPDA
ncbi:pyrimidine dimer DNA glycosylase/endonuclease V [Tsukamurella sp. 8F]|uniref:pyrimidine dimer DNA glycosylase/endonuclease V n=1 Tax=unclassified Tsukamurella TaxID=2633480 RepID=UPI0023BA3AC2|nr:MULTISPECIES: pyrimidine dimer DNA glycosylase/endonuclease V [unclassified Tsukamurella]MDF0532200.1 pyrimidine dimer DNA glycosylase/endonuclease V [Tsukamurella sp. 8J]MDF0589237.1 pyrimidine dimer DNA glycosylase/endonuclease V [Tsukamurella sp. 8F]